MSKDKVFFTQEYTVPVESPTRNGETIQLSRVVPVKSFVGNANDRFDDAISFINDVEDGLVMYSIEVPKIANRYVLANKYLDNDHPAFLSIVSNKYRVIRSNGVLSALKASFETVSDKENWTILAKVSSSVFVRLQHTRDPRLTVVYGNSYDRTIRESIVLPGLLNMKYTHTRRGTRKVGIDEVLKSALDIAAVEQRYQILDKFTISKRSLIRFVLNSMSMTRRSIVRKFFSYTPELTSEKKDEDYYENMFFELYFKKYGESLKGFAEFVYDVYDYFAKMGKISKSLLVLQAGTSIVQTVLSV